MKERKPASPTAVSSSARKDRRATSWLRGKERRRKRAEAQEAAHKRNKADPDLTPWEVACDRRRSLHQADKMHGRWQPVERNPAGYIRRSDGTRTWWEDPGAKERKHYLSTVVRS
jgi:hypothetical protein